MIVSCSLILATTNPFWRVINVHYYHHTNMEHSEILGIKMGNDHCLRYESTQRAADRFKCGQFWDGVLDGWWVHCHFPFWWKPKRSCLVHLAFYNFTFRYHFGYLRLQYQVLPCSAFVWVPLFHLLFTFLSSVTFRFNFRLPFWLLSTLASVPISPLILLVGLAAGALSPKPYTNAPPRFEAWSRVPNTTVLSSVEMPGWQISLKWGTDLPPDASYMN